MLPFLLSSVLPILKNIKKKIGHIFPVLCMSRNLGFYREPCERYALQTLENTDLDVQQSAQLGLDCTFCRTFGERWFTSLFISLVWACPAHVYLRIEPEESVGSLPELEAFSSWSSLLWFSSLDSPAPKRLLFLFPWEPILRVGPLATPTAPWVSPSGQSCRENHWGTHAPLSPPTSPFGLQVLALHHCGFDVTFRKPQVVVFLYFDKEFFILIIRKYILPGACVTMLRLELVFQ